MYTPVRSSTIITPEPAGFRDVSVARTEWNRYGIKMDGSCRVVYVCPCSAAERDGIRVGNALVGIDGALVRSKDDVVREWARNHAADYVALSFDQRIDDQPNLLPSEAGKSVTVSPLRLFFPAKALKAKKEVVNTVTLSNFTTREHLFALRSSHPADIVVRQREGILGPCGSDSNTTRIEIVWSPSRPYDFTRPDWGPHSADYPQLRPPRQPVVSVIIWERGAGLQLATVPAACKAETELPISFVRPTLGSDDYDFRVAEVVYRSSEADTCSALSLSAIDSATHTSSPSRVMFHQQLIQDERERASFRRARDRMNTPSVVSLTSAEPSSPSTVSMYADTESLRPLPQEIQELRQEISDLRRQLESIQSRPAPPPPAKPAEGCVIL